uniref:Uncharacterized protein n=1 Tax=Erpetoichthys calabaricus TaxID=27687 RepID=A0A8C4SP16_ERPCA
MHENFYHLTNICHCCFFFFGLIGVLHTNIYKIFYTQIFLHSMSVHIKKMLVVSTSFMCSKTHLIIVSYSRGPAHPKTCVKNSSRSKVLELLYFYFAGRDKRDFVSAGAAAGVAAAFGAPIGGTLFSLEEGSSFWNQALTWKVLFCSMSATFTLNFFRSGIQFSSWGSFQLPGLLNFGEFKCSDADKQCHLWTAVDLAFFVVMGVCGGLLGATFNCLNKRLAKYRMKNVYPKAKFVRILEGLLVAMITTIVIFVSSMTLGECRDLSIPTSHEGNTSLHQVSVDVNSSIKTFFCPNKTYNDMATLFFNPQEVAILQLFHQDGMLCPMFGHLKDCKHVKQNLCFFFLCLINHICCVVCHKSGE